MSRRGTPERFLTTVVMTDMVGSTEHAAELGDTGWRELLELHHSLVRSALRRAGGREIDTAGDGFFVTFDAPAAAVAFALEIERRSGRARGGHPGGCPCRRGRADGLEGDRPDRRHRLADHGRGGCGRGPRVVDRARPDRRLEPRPSRIAGSASSRACPASGTSTRSSGPGPSLSTPSGPATATERRAAAVRRAQARPIWQRRPRLVVATALGLAVVLATGGLLLAKPWQPAALASVTEDSIGIIDPARDEVIGQIPVGTRPGGIAVGGGSVWVTNTGADTVSQIDLARALGGRPHHRCRSVAQGDRRDRDSVWVANSGERSVTRINIASGRVVQTIAVGNSPTAIVATGDGLWVANATDSTIVRIDAAAGKVGEPVGVAAKPVALAADADGLWVASEDGASVSHHDPATGATREPPIRLNARPTALAIDPTSVWVAAADGKVTRIDRAGGGVTATIPVGAKPRDHRRSSGDAIWVGDLDGTVSRVDAANQSAPPRRIATGSAVATLAVVDGGVWLAAQASASSHRGGTLRMVGVGYGIDPLQSASLYDASLYGDGLIGYRRVRGQRRVRVAAGPRRLGSADQRRRTDLHVPVASGPGVLDRRPGPSHRFSACDRTQLPGETDPGGAPSSAQRHACRRTTRPSTSATCPGASSPTMPPAPITYNLSAPDPDFLYKLAHPAAFPVPEGVPMHRLPDDEAIPAFPGTGPYMVTAATENEIRLGRNPRFRVWDPAVRPDGFPDEIVFTFDEGEACPSRWSKETRPTTVRSSDRPMSWHGYRHSTPTGYTAGRQGRRPSSR